jgi:hypothetical protein
MPRSRSISSRRPVSAKKSGARKRAASAKVASSKSRGVAPGKAGFLLKFRAADSSYGVTRGTVKAISDALGLTETQVVHIALNRKRQAVPPTGVHTTHSRLRTASAKDPFDSSGQGRDDARILQFISGLGVRTD